MLMYNCEVDLLKERNLMRPYSREELLAKLAEITEMIGKVPTQRDLREFGMSEDPFYRVFGNYSNAKQEFITGGTGIDGSPKEVRVEVASNKEKDSLVNQLAQNFSVEELKAMVASSKGERPNQKRTPIHTKVTGRFKALVTGDSHIGHSKFREDWWYSMIDNAVSEKVDFCWHTGDILEGMSNRPGHIYELDCIGFEAQFAKAKRLIGDCPFQVRGIIGNHSMWFLQKADQGVNVGLRLEESLDNFVYLGLHECTELIDNIKVMLWHGMDGAAYSISYRTQKFIENLQGGEKPNILLAGHSHKSLFYETRNVHVMETGTLCEQTGFMRNKKLAAHTGYWIIEVFYNEYGVVKIIPQWNAFY